MSAKEWERLRVDFPERPNGRFWRFNKTDWSFCILMLAVLLLANHFFGKMAAVFAIIVWFCAMVPVSYGRPYSIFIQKLRNHWMTLAHKAPSAKSEVSIWSADEKRLIKRPEPIRLSLHGIDGLGFLHQVGGWDTIVVAAQGGTSSSEGIESQFDHHRMMGEVMRKAAAMTQRGGYNVGCGWHFRTRPVNMPDLVTSLKSYMHPQALLPDALEETDESRWSKDDRRWLAVGHNLQQLFEVTATYSRDVTMAAVYTVKRQEFDRRIADNEANRLSVVQLAKRLPEELAACGVIDPHALTPREMHGYFRSAWDVASLDDYYEWSSKSSDEEVLRSDRHLPKDRISAGAGYLLVDGTYTTVLWLMDAPSPMYPHELSKIYELNVPWFSVSMVGHTTSSKGEYAFLDRWISLSSELEAQAGVVHRGPKKLAKEESRIDRQTKIFKSRFGMDYNVLIAVHHYDRQALEEDVDTAIQHLSLSNLTVTRVMDPVWQLPFALSATTGIDIGML